MIEIFPNANRLEPRYFVTVTDIYGQKVRYMFCDRLDALAFAFKAKKLDQSIVNVTLKRQLYTTY